MSASKVSATVLSVCCFARSKTGVRPFGPGARVGGLAGAPACGADPAAEAAAEAGPDAGPDAGADAAGVPRRAPRPASEAGAAPASGQGGTEGGTEDGYGRRFAHRNGHTGKIYDYVTSSRARHSPTPKSPVRGHCQGPVTANVVPGA